MGSSSVGYYLYNDEKPDGSSSSYRGHTKGVSVFDANGGFFLDHSVPRFPPAAEDAYEFPQNEATYGQSFMCVSGDSTALEVIFGQWLYTYPNDYSSNIPEALQSIYPNLVQVRLKIVALCELCTVSATPYIVCGHSIVDLMCLHAYAGGRGQARNF